MSNVTLSTVPAPAGRAWRLAFGAPRREPPPRRRYIRRAIVIAAVPLGIILAAIAP